MEERFASDPEPGTSIARIHNPDSKLRKHQGFALLRVAPTGFPTARDELTRRGRRRLKRRSVRGRCLFNIQRVFFGLFHTGRR